MQYLISIDDLSTTEIKTLIQRALYLKTCPQAQYLNYAKHQACTLFYENSTRTYMSFNLAAQHCRLPLLSLNMQNSSEKKGESFLDTILSLHAMGIQLFIIRHEQSYIFSHIVNKLPLSVKLINAGDGQNEHPSQALLDMMTIIEHYHELGRLGLSPINTNQREPICNKAENHALCEGMGSIAKSIQKLKIAVIGNIKHSRVARSFKKLCAKLDINNLIFISPPLWQAQDLTDTAVTTDINYGLLNADVIITLRIQQERLSTNEQYDLTQYQIDYGLTQQRLSVAKPNAIILHPGPINRGIEITSELADSPKSCILKQVKNGVFMRMAIIEAVLKE